MRACFYVNVTLPCECAGSSFVDKGHYHIISRNLKVITNNKLLKYFSEAPMYREIELGIMEKLRKA